jgi:transcriptional regulator with XRE-family HTH domain
MDKLERLRAVKKSKRLTYPRIAKLIGKSKRSIENYFQIDKTGKPRCNISDDSLGILERI